MGWEKAGQNPLESGAELKNPEQFAVQNVALKPPFNGKALWRITAFYYCHQRPENSASYLQSRVCQGNPPLPNLSILVS